MHLSDEGILTQLGYPVNETNLKQLKLVEKNTPGFDTIKRHIIALNDHLKPYDSFIAFSSSKNHFKIKIHTNTPTKQEAAIDTMQKWANKYNISLEEVKPKATYYILGISSC